MFITISRAARFKTLWLALLAVALGASTASAAATADVSITSNRFTDSASGNSTTTINAGDSVKWTWNGSNHSTTSGSCASGCSADGIWDSDVKNSGSTFTQAFPTAGTFPYFCEVHGSMMQGTVVVQGSQTAPTANFTFTPTGVPIMGTPIQFTDSSTGSPTAWTWNFGDPASGTSNVSAQQNPTHVFQAAGTYTVSLQASNGGGSNTTTKSITISAGGGLPCVVSDTQLCLNGGRFSVTAAWEKPDGSSGDGHGIGLTADSGYFWFFDAANIEMVIKVLNGCGLNPPAYWVFAAGLTNVSVHMTVVDTQTGIVYANDNPQGTPFVPIQDTRAFPNSCP